MVRVLWSAVCFICYAEAVAVLMEVQDVARAKPVAWKVSGPSPKDEQIELTFAVKQRGLPELHDTLMRVSSPSSPDYGKHLSNEEVNSLTAPEPSDIKTVLSFLKQHGVEDVRALTPNSDVIGATVSIKTAEKMLDAVYLSLVHQKSGTAIHRAVGGYSLPAEVAAAVDFVAPTVHVPGVRRPSAPSNNSVGSGFGDMNTPPNLRKLYNIGNTVGKAATNKQAVTAFLEQGYVASDLKEFWSTYCDGLTCGKGDVKLVGDATGGSAGIESMLDIESITGMAGNVASEFWGYSGRSPDNTANEPFMKWLTQMSSTSDADVPKIFSTSYGEDEGAWSLAAATRLNAEFQKAGVRGISLLFAAGDEGANCKGGKFVPEGPGSSPYVTAVGGTGPTSGYPKPTSEKGIGLSSGGFSNYWPMPEWQKDAVAKYLKQKGLPPASRGYNTSGRAYPDIAAQATNFIVIAGGTQPGVAGTSLFTDRCWRLLLAQRSSSAERQVNPWFPQPDDLRERCGL